MESESGVYFYIHDYGASLPNRCLNRKSQGNCPKETRVKGRISQNKCCNVYGISNEQQISMISNHHLLKMRRTNIALCIVSIIINEIYKPSVPVMLVFPLPQDFPSRVASKAKALFCQLDSWP